MPTTINIHSLSAAHELASAIELGDTVVVTDDRMGLRTRETRTGDYTEVRLEDAEGRQCSATVTIQRASVRWSGAVEDSQVNWSSFGTADLATAEATVKVLQLAIDAARQINEWVRGGKSLRVNAELAAIQEERRNADRQRSERQAKVDRMREALEQYVNRTVRIKLHNGQTVKGLYWGMVNTRVIIGSGSGRQREYLSDSVAEFAVQPADQPFGRYSVVEL
jgi:hypothetical protein